MEIRSYYLSLPAIVVCSKQCANPLNITAEQHKISLKENIATRDEVPKI